VRSGGLVTHLAHGETKRRPDRGQAARWRGRCLPRVRGNRRPGGWRDSGRRGTEVQGAPTPSFQPATTSAATSRCLAPPWCPEQGTVRSIALHLIETALRWPCRHLPGGARRWAERTPDGAGWGLVGRRLGQALATSV